MIILLLALIGCVTVISALAQFARSVELPAPNLDKPSTALVKVVKEDQCS